MPREIGKQKIGNSVDLLIKDIRDKKWDVFSLAIHHLQEGFRVYDVENKTESHPLVVQALQNRLKYKNSIFPELMEFCKSNKDSDRLGISVICDLQEQEAKVNFTVFEVVKKK